MIDVNYSKFDIIHIMKEILVNYLYISNIMSISMPKSALQLKC